MTLQMLTYFISVARHRNFTRAAEECFVTQPALSRAISDLEEELQCRLLNRTSRSVSLTPAGEVCLTEAMRVIGACDRLTERVREADRAAETPVRLGYIIYDHLMYLFRLIYKEDNPGQRHLLEPSYIACTELKQRFKEGEMDAVLLPEPCAADLQDADCIPILRGRAHVILSASHPLYHRKEISISELSDSRIIEWADDVPLLRAAYADLCRSGGFEPNIVDTAAKMGDMVAKLLAHNAVGFGTAVGHEFREGIRYVPLSDGPERFGLICAFHREPGTPGTERLRTDLRSMVSPAGRIDKQNS
ncbi:MAG: LysR family transcriptional regulator [Clostridia bacterium]|nr:LysR family transcriptional regulator [Clostridia bacterium]